METFIIRKSGRPKGDIELRKLRSKTWYLSIKTKENLNDSQLDILFGPDDGDGKRRVSSDRLKIFEAIRKNGSIPSDGTMGGRGFNLIERVDADPSYSGTANIINSPFWTLLENEPLSVEKLRQIVVKCVINLGLANESPFSQDDGQNRVSIRDLIRNNEELTIDNYYDYQMKGDQEYDNLMGDSLLELRPNLDYLSLLIALTFEAIQAGNLIIAASLTRSSIKLLKIFCQEKWLLTIGDDLYKFTSRRILAALNNDSLKGLPSYKTILSNSNEFSNGSYIIKFLSKHEEMIWRRFDNLNDEG